MNRYMFSSSASSSPHDIFNHLHVSLSLLLPSFPLIFFSLSLSEKSQFCRLRQRLLLRLCAYILAVTSTLRTFSLSVFFQWTVAGAVGAAGTGARAAAARARVSGAGPVTVQRP